MFLRPSTPPASKLSLRGLGKGQGQGQGQGQQNQERSLSNEERALNALAQLARDAVQHMVIDKDKDEEQLGVEVLLQLIGHLIRNGSSRTITTAAAGANKNANMEKVTILAPETQYVQDDVEGSLGKEKKYLEPPVPETVPLVDLVRQLEGGVSQGDNDNSSSSLEVAKAKPNGRFTNSFMDEDDIKIEEPNHDERVEIAQNSRYKPIVGGDEGRDLDEWTEEVMLANQNDQEDEEESPSILRGKRSKGAMLKEATASNKPKAVKKKVKATNRFGIDVTDASPSQVRRMINMKQTKIDSYRQKKGEKMKKRLNDSEDDEDIKRAKLESLKLARIEKESRKKLNKLDLDDSFDVPVTKDEKKADFKHVNEPVRNKMARRKLKAFDCAQCREYYKDVQMTDEEREKLLAACSRHRAEHSPPPSSPQDFLKTDFSVRNTPEVDEEPSSPLKPRRRRKNL